jgi:hypothetical protein
MSESESAQPALDAQAAKGDPLAERILLAYQLLAALNADPEVRHRLHLRLSAICTSLKVPGANRTRGAQRLDRLMADAEQARLGDAGRSE